MPVPASWLSLSAFQEVAHDVCGPFFNGRLSFLKLSLIVVVNGEGLMALTTVLVFVLWLWSTCEASIQVPVHHFARARRQEYWKII